MPFVRADILASPTSESVEAFVTEIARQRSRLAQKRSFDSVRDAAHALGLQRVARKQVVVGGTNGKGSTVQYLQQLLSHQGIRVGTTTSPHVNSYLERIMLDGAPVHASQCSDAIQSIADTTRDIPLSYFDLTTLAALHIFKQREVDVAVVEVGLGGRLDCANVVDNDIAVITNVDIDHGAILGDTIDAITREKVPIARPNKPLVFADKRANTIVHEYAHANGNPLFRLGSEFGISGAHVVFFADGSETRTMPIPSSIDYALESFSSALQVAALLQHAPSGDQLASTQFATPEGRFEHCYTRGRHWILDVAHNPSAIWYLRRALARQNFTECVVVFACLSDKDVRGMLESLMKRHNGNAAKVISIVITDSQGERALSANAVRRELSEVDCAVQVESEIADALVVASNQVTQKDVPIVVLGSFDVVSRTRNALNT